MKLKENILTLIQDLKKKQATSSEGIAARHVLNELEKEIQAMKPEKHEINLLFGDDVCSCYPYKIGQTAKDVADGDGNFIHHEFQTEEELNAYITGLEDQDRWYERKTIRDVDLEVFTDKSFPLNDLIKAEKWFDVADDDYLARKLNIQHPPKDETDDDMEFDEIISKSWEETPPRERIRIYKEYVKTGRKRRHGKNSSKKFFI